MTNLDATQEAHLKAFEAAYGVLVIAKRDADERYAAMKEAELTGLKIDASKAARRAVTVGVPIARLGDKDRGGMKTRNFNTIKAFLDLTADYATETAEDLYIDPLASRYSFDAEANTLTVTFTGEIWTKACWELDWDERMALSLGLNVAEFEIGYQANGRPILKPTTPNFLPDHGNNHPVVTAVLRNDTEAVEWLEGVVGK